MTKYLKSEPFSFSYSHIPKDRWEETFGGKAFPDLPPKNETVGWKLSELSGFTLVDPILFLNVKEVKEGDWIFWGEQAEKKLILRQTQQVKKISEQKNVIQFIFEEGDYIYLQNDDRVFCAHSTCTLPVILTIRNN